MHLQVQLHMIIHHMPAQEKHLSRDRPIAALIDETSEALAVLTKAMMEQRVRRAAQGAFM
jgi:hypothetical protein